MSPARHPTNVAASVRARLLELSRRRGVEFQLVLSDFAIERLLYRLGVSPHAERFVLKGAMLFKLWSDDRHRATWDLDLLGRGASTVADVVAVIRDLCGIGVDDGIAFDPESLAGEEIRATEEYADWARAQLCDLASSVNVAGRHLQVRLNDVRRCYYWCFVDETEGEGLRACPGCDQALVAAPNPFGHGLCDRCSLIGPLAEA